MHYYALLNFGNESNKFLRTMLISEYVSFSTVKVDSLGRKGRCIIMPGAIELWLWYACPISHLCFRNRNACAVYWTSSYICRSMQLCGGEHRTIIHLISECSHVGGAICIPLCSYAIYIHQDSMCSRAEIMLNIMFIALLSLVSASLWTCLLLLARNVVRLWYTS